MSKLFSINANNTLNISVEERLFQNICKAHTWYTSKAVCIPLLAVFAAIDIAGFWQIAASTIMESKLNRGIIISALAVAYEIAPLYIGYSICLKCYGLGKRIHNWTLLFSCSACILGIVGNIYFRLKTIDVAYINPTTLEVFEIGFPLTVLMCILPIITTLVNLVIGCLTFDPLQFDLTQLSKKLSRLRLYKQQVMASLQEFNDENTLQANLEKEESDCYERIQNHIYATQMSLKTYIIVRVSNTTGRQKQ